MQNLFNTIDEKVYIHNTNKYHLNSVSFCFNFQLSYYNAAYLNILEEVTKDYFHQTLSEYPITFYTQILKKDQLFLFIIYFQYPLVIEKKNLFQQPYLNLITENVNKFIMKNNVINLNNFKKYKELSLKKINIFESDIKTIAIKECLEILDDEYVSYYGKKTDVLNISPSSFLQWFSDFITSRDVQKQVFLIGKFSKLEVLLISNTIPNSNKYTPTTNIQKLIKSPLYIEKYINCNIGFLVIALQIKNHETFSNKAISFLSEYLGGGGFSLLFNKVREEKKLVYEIGTTANVNKGEIIITAKVNKENIQNVIKRVDEEILKLQRGVIDELHYLSTLNSLNLTEARNIDRPLTLTRSYINYLTNVKREKKFSKDEFECLIKQVKKAVTVSVTEV